MKQYKTIFCKLLALFLFSEVYGFLPSTNPPWPQTYNITSSTLTMAWNTSGEFDIKFASLFGIVSYDWSNEKSEWVNQSPMDCEERMLSQAKITKTYSPETNVFVYRNLVKALPWFSSVRKILLDPAYSGFFLTFKNFTLCPFNENVDVDYDEINREEEECNYNYRVPVCTTQHNVTKCSRFYHDQEQTPQVPNKTHPNPDGACMESFGCDCGDGLPCGEYLFDHRNGSMLTEWLLNEYILSDTAIGSPYIDGLFIDDFWCSYILNGTKQCRDPGQGPSEINNHSQIDMGLSDQDILDITNGWLLNMEIVQKAILKYKSYTWSLIPNQENANASPTIITPLNCQAQLDMACNENNTYINAPLLSGLYYNSSMQEFPFLHQQIASFLLMRGPYAYIGYGEWGMRWPQHVPLPQEIWGTDYGIPLNSTCEKVDDNFNVYRRYYTNAEIYLDCDAWEAKFNFF